MPIILILMNEGSRVYDVSGRVKENAGMSQHIARKMQLMYHDKLAICLTMMTLGSSTVSVGRMSR